jgi:hypothetical protein
MSKAASPPRAAISRVLDAVFWPVVVAGVLAVFMWLNPARAVEPWAPWHLRLDLGGGRFLLSADGYTTRPLCEDALGRELLSFAVSPLLVRTGRCVAAGDHA